MERGLIALAAALAVMSGIVTGIYEGKVAIKAVEMTGKNPEAADKIKSVATTGAAISETCAVYGLFVAILILLIMGR